MTAVSRIEFPADKWPAEFVHILDQLAGQGAWLVGGAVLDLLRGRHPGDLDAVANVRAQDLHTLGGTPIGGRHDTHAWRSAGFVLEISPLRGNSLHEDLLSRDLSIHAIAAAWDDGQVIDPAGGLTALTRHELRLTDQTGRTFAEDPFRIIRVFRRVADGFSIGADVHNAIIDHSHALDSQPPERLGPELEKLLVGQRAGHALRVLRTYTLAWESVLGRWRVADAAISWSLASNIVALAGRKPGIRFAALMRALGVDRTSARTILQNWAVPQGTRKKAEDLIASIDELSNLSINEPGLLRAWHARFGTNVADSLSLWRAVGYDQSQRQVDSDRLSSAIQTAARVPYPARPADMDLSGDELFAIVNIEPRRRADFLNRLWLWVLTDPEIRNNSDAIADRARSLSEEPG